MGQYVRLVFARNEYLIPEGSPANCHFMEMSKGCEQVAVRWELKIRSLGILAGLETC